MSMSFFSFLSPEYDRIPRLCPNLWMQNLTNNFETNIRTQGFLCEFSKFEEICNNLGLLTFYAGLPNISRTLCQRAQDMFYHVYQVRKNGCPNKFGILQPWINLVRLDRFMGNLKAAWSRSQTLKPDLQNRTYMFDEKRLPESDLNLAARRLLRFCFIEESVKILVQQKDRGGFDQFLQENLADVPLTPGQLHFLIEAKIILLAHSGRKNELETLLAAGMEADTPEIAAIYALKEVHYHLLEGDHQLGSQKCEALLDTYKQDLTLQKKNSEGMAPLYIYRFWLQFMRTLAPLSLMKEVYQLSETLFEGFSYYKDALSQTELCLVMANTPEKRPIYAEFLNDSLYRRILSKDPHPGEWVKQCENFATKVMDHMAYIRREY